MKQFINIITGVILTPSVEEVEKQFEASFLYQEYKAKKSRRKQKEDPLDEDPLLNAHEEE